MLKPQLIIIDGYNLLHAISDLKPLLAANLEYARDQLLLKLGDYRRTHARPPHILVIFDGTHAPGHLRNHRYFDQGVEVIFSPISVEADTVILELVEQHSEKGSLAVVSSDAADITGQLRRRGVNTVTSTDFLKELIIKPELPVESSPDTDLHEDLRRRQHRSQPLVRIHKGWVSIRGGYDIEAITLNGSGHFELLKNSQPEGVKINQRRQCITLINAEKSLLPQDILFEFKGKLTLVNCEILRTDGSVLKAMIDLV